MANNFDVKDSRVIGTSLTTIGSYTVAANTKAIVIGLTLCNVSNGQSIAVNLTHHDGTNDNYILKDVPILPGATLAPDQKIVLKTGHSLKASANVASSLDVVMSVLELT